MKYIVLISIGMLMQLSSFAQTKVEYRSEYDYCEIIGYDRLFSTKKNIKIDAGQATKWFDDTRYRDKKGDIVTFNSMMDALNFMAEQGWEFMQAYVTSSGGGQNTSITSEVHYIMRRKKQE